MTVHLSRGRAEEGAQDVSWFGTDDKRMFTSVPCEFGDGELMDGTQLIWASKMDNITGNAVVNAVLQNLPPNQ